MMSSLVIELRIHTTISHTICTGVCFIRESKPTSIEEEKNFHYWCFSRLSKSRGFRSLYSPKIMHPRIGAWWNWLRSSNVENQSNKSFGQYTTRWILWTYVTRKVVLVRHSLTMNASSRMTWGRCGDGGQVSQKHQICLGGTSWMGIYFWTLQRSTVYK